MRRRQPSASELLEAVPEGTVLLILYLVAGTPPRMLCTIVTREGVVMSTQPILVGDELGVIDPALPAINTFEAATLMLRRGIQEDPGTRIVAQAAGTFLEGWPEKALGPALDMLRQLHDRGFRHLVVVPDGALHVFPFHLIGPVGRPLCEDWLVTFMPSPFALAAISAPRRRFRQARAVALGIDFVDYPDTSVSGRAGDSNNQQFTPLPDAVTEAYSVAEAAEGTALTNREATKTALATALEEARWVHVATHGTSNAYAPSFNSLAVWPDGDNGRLASYELLGLDLRDLDLVTLSACETALGRFDVADNVRGLAATLLRAGTRSVIGTLWPVESMTSAFFFTSLYRSLGQGAPTSVAFRNAQAATRVAHPAYRDWGAFTLIGSW